MSVAKRLSCLLLLFAATAAWAIDSGKVEIAEIKVVGGNTITKDTVEYYLGVSEGDPLDAAEVAKSFKKLWDSGLVEDLKLESEVIVAGKVRLIVTLRERPKVSEYTFAGNKKLSTATIREKLDTANVSLKRNVPLRTSEVQRLRQAITDVYAKEGYASAVIEPVIAESGPNQRKVTFKVDEGVKVRIGTIRFNGNHVYSDFRLRWALKKIKQHSLLHLFGKKLIWSKESWGEDSENLKKFYMNRGYKDIVVGEPKVEMVARNPKGMTQKEKKYRMVLTIPVQEGKRFRMGTLSLQGVTVMKPDALRKLYDVKSGRIYNYSKVEQGSESVRNLYQSFGYIYAYTKQELEARKNEPDVVDVIVKVDEGDRFRLGRLEFAGNTKTQDKVIRREFRIGEGDYMNMAAFKRSVFKVNQLGYFKLKEDPLEFKFDDKEKLVNVLVKGEEVGRTDVQFGAGYSELDHLFAQASFGTRNFLGRGENLGVSAQVGKRGNSYSLSLTEPYFLDQRMSIGGSITKQNVDLTDLSTVQQYLRNSKGGTIFWGLGVGDFGQFSVAYGYEDDSAQYSTTRELNGGDGPAFPRRRPLPTPYPGIAAEPLFLEKYAGVTSSITPSFGVDSRDDPFDPNQGTSAFVRLRWAGGPLKGDFDYLRPEAGFALFLPISRHNIFAFNIEAGIMLPYGGVEIPVYDRYRLGGEHSLRGFELYSVLPRDRAGNYFRDANGVELGGDRFAQLNIEYQIKIGGPVKFILFSDIGNTWYETQGWDLGLLRRSVGAEVRITLPMFQAPLRFIYGVNLKPFSDEKKGDFTFSIGTTF